MKAIYHNLWCFSTKKLFPSGVSQLLLLSSTTGSYLMWAQLLQCSHVSQSTTIVRSSWIHFACILVAPSRLSMPQAKGLLAAVRTVEGEQLQCRQNGSNLIYTGCVLSGLTAGGVLPAAMSNNDRRPKLGNCPTVQQKLRWNDPIIMVFLIIKMRSRIYISLSNQYRPISLNKDY